MHRYFLVYKPFNVLSQFTSNLAKQTLADLFFVPKDVYPVGRLDYDSEGLLILTNDPALNHQLLNPNNKHEREYWVQVEGMITQQALIDMEKGVVISIDRKPYKTIPAKAKHFANDPAVPERNPPVRFRKSVPTTWISLTLTEGKNRQVRRMTARIGFPTLRLIRCRIGKITLKDLLPGEMKELTKTEIYKNLFT